MLKFPVKGGIVMIRGTTIIPAECKMVTEAQDLIPPKEPAVTERIKVAIHPEYSDQTVMIGGRLSKKGRMELCNLLKENLDIFASKPADMTGVPCSIAEHRLNIREGYQPIRQKRRGRHRVGIKRSKRKSPSWWKLDEGSALPRLALKPSHGKEARWQLENVRRLHRFK
ncbi:hypothetical protein Tco_1279859 [Tanacetum coccineum]